MRSVEMDLAREYEPNLYHDAMDDLRWGKSPTAVNKRLRKRLADANERRAMRNYKMIPIEEELNG